jgi:4-amino-4-deoxy-L-arabinose transferase-like glycosyltransferase
LIMLGPAIAALTAITAWSLWQQMQKNYWLGWTLTLIFTGITVIYQITVIRQYPNYAQPMTAIMIITWLIGIALLATFKIQQWLRNLSVALIAIALLVSPLTLAVLTTLNKHPDIALPNASPDISQNSRPMMDSTLSGEQQIILDYLLTNTDQDDYLVAALDSHEAAPYILATGRPVLTFGGFNGRDDVISLDQLVHMIDYGKIKFILGGDQLMQSKPDIGRWVNTHCSIVSLPGISRLITPDNSALPGQAARSELYDCSIK